MPADDARIHTMVAGAARVGIDSPFGWPDDFVDFVVAQHRGELSAGSGLDDVSRRRPLAYRTTDLYVAALAGGRRPLSVSADNIAHVAFRCAGLLADLGITDRASGWAIEAYPAAALRRWGLQSRGYKTAANVSAREVMVEQLGQAAPWLDLNSHADAMIADDDAFDAVITALIARTADLGLTPAPPDDVRDTAMREGWIHVPDCELDQLVSSAGP